jgi:hypothetical protein
MHILESSNTLNRTPYNGGIQLLNMIVEQSRNTPRWSNCVTAIIAALLLLPAIASNAADVNGECYFNVSGRIPSGWRYSIEVQNSSGSWQNISYGYSSVIPDSFYASDVGNWKNKNVSCRYTIWPSGSITQTPVSFTHPAGQKNFTLNINIATPNPAPTVTLTSPLSGATFKPGDKVTLSASASDRTSTGAVGVISKVEFFSGNTSLGVDNTAPYGIAWNPTASGNYILTARATDSQGAVGTSASSALSIVADPTQPTITTIAGSGISGYADGLGNTARFNGPCAIAVHSSGNIYIADTSNHRIRKITNTGIVSTIAGSGAKSFGDGTGVAASFNSPVGIAVDANENLYVVDLGNNRIRKITPNGVVTTAWYGSPQILRPQSIAVDANGNIYLTDPYQNKIQKINIK